MYKIYINETPLLLVKEKVGKDMLPAGKDELIVPYFGKSKSLLNYIDLLEKSAQLERVVIYHRDLDDLIDDYESLYKIIEAAGGLVNNEVGELLFIHRLGYWDLPKGKIEKGEKKKQAALREVEEETGLRNIEIGKRLLITYHTYKNGKGKRILKRTFWYSMKASKQQLIPETEENIEKAVWMTLEEFRSEDRAVYKNILEVLASKMDDET